jgi:hypothetical protein
VRSARSSDPPRRTRAFRRMRSIRAARSRIRASGAWCVFPSIDSFQPARDALPWERRGDALIREFGFLSFTNEKKTTNPIRPNAAALVGPILPPEGLPVTCGVVVANDRWHVASS